MSTIINWLLDIIIIALALWAVTFVIPGISIAPPSTTWYADGQYDLALVFLAVAAVFMVINTVVTPVLKLIGLPVTCLTFGLFVLVINAVVFMLTGWISRQLGLGLFIEDFWAALWGALVLAIVRGVLGMLTGALRPAR